MNTTKCKITLKYRIIARMHHFDKWKILLGFTVDDSDEQFKLISNAKEFTLD